MSFPIKPIQYFLSLFFLGFLFFLMAPGKAFAVADLNITVSDAGQPVEGATVRLTFPDGSQTTREDRNNDGQIDATLTDSGSHRATVTTPDGRTQTATFDAPAQGSVTIGFDLAPGGTPQVQVNDTSQPARSSRTSGPKDIPISLGVLGSYGMSDWNSQLIDLGDFNNQIEGDTRDLDKAGFGAELRFGIPNSDFFVSNRFFYHVKDEVKDPLFIPETNYGINLREQLRNQLLFGWNFADLRPVRLNLLAGFTLAKMEMEVAPIGSGSSEEMFVGSQVLRSSEVQFVPTFGAEGEIPLNREGNIFWMFGFTASIMNSVHVDDVEENERFRVDNDLQWDMHSGFRVRF